MSKKKYAAFLLVAARSPIAAALLATAIGGCQSSPPGGSGDVGGAPTPAAAAEEHIRHPEAPAADDRVEQLPVLTDRLGTSGGRLFVRALKTTDLWETLQEEGPFTVFVPVDLAVQALDKQLFTEAQRDLLKQLLACHIVPRKLFTRDLMAVDSLPSLGAHKLTIEVKGGKVTVDGCRLLFKDTEARNGVIHFIYPAIRAK